MKHIKKKKKKGEKFLNKFSVWTQKPQPKLENLLCYSHWNWSYSCSPLVNIKLIVVQFLWCYISLHELRIWSLNLSWLTAHMGSVMICRHILLHHMCLHETKVNSEDRFVTSVVPKLRTDEAQWSRASVYKALFQPTLHTSAQRKCAEDQTEG